MSRPPAPPASEYENEPIPGLPEVPPEGEEILWQGAPSAWGLARHAFHADKVALYFGLLAAFRVGLSLSEGLSVGQALVSASLLVVMGALGVGILATLAWLNARVTIYTITNRRVVMRFGVAITLAVNFPFTAIGSIGLKTRRDGTGDLALEVDGASQLGALMLWPHVRPWTFGSQVQPMLRSVPDGKAVGDLLQQAVAGSLRPERAHASALEPEPSRPPAGPPVASVA